MNIRICFCGEDDTSIGKHTTFVFTKPSERTAYFNVSRIGNNCVFINTFWLDFPDGEIPDGTMISGNVSKPDKIIRVESPFRGTAILFGKKENLKNWLFYDGRGQQTPLLERIEQFKRTLPSWYQRVFVSGAEERKEYRRQLKNLDQLIRMLKNS